MIVALVSCNKDQYEVSDVQLKEAYVESYSTPISIPGGITPVILAVDKPKGGNVSCTDVEQAFDVDLLCGTKIDYVSEDQFEGAFPEWLNVELDGIYVSFNMDGCVTIDGKQYKVGAVIVKGSNAANVYFYDGGTLSDGHLAAPGDKYMVSNLTFCFVECTTPDLVIAAKAYLVNNWVCTSGGPADIDFVGYYNFEPDFVGNKLYYYAREDMPIGNIVVSNVDADNLWEVTLGTEYAPGYFYTNVFLFVGTLEQYNALRTTYGEDFYNHFNYLTGVFSATPSVTVNLDF